MRINSYDVHPGVLTITVATPRDPEIPSALFTAASIHEDYCGRVRALLREYKHVGESSNACPAAQRLQAYFPAHEGKPLYALRALVPSGAPREIDPEFMLEVLRIRYEFILVDLPEAMMADAIIAEGRERAMEKALHDLLEANGVPAVFIPSNNDQRNPNRSEVDIICEFGPSTGRRSFEVAV